MFANPNHPTVEYHYRPDGTRPYSHCEDRDLFRVINVEGDCVYYLRKLTDVFRVALTAVGMTIDPLGPRAPYCPVRSCPYLPSPAPPAVRWTVRTFKIGVSNIDRPGLLS